MGKKRKDHVPQDHPKGALPKSRCSGTKFLAAVGRLSSEKIVAINAMGFGGLLQLATKEIRYELCNWLISAYDVPYHRIRMATSSFVEITLGDVEAAMGIPCRGLDVPVHPRRVASGRLYNMGYLESKLESLPIGDEFNKIFLIFTCATILAPNSKPEGMHDMWDYIWDNDVVVPRNWGQFMLDYLEDGIREFKANKGRYVRGCLLFLQIFYLSKTYLPAILVEVRVPWCSVWPDQTVKGRLAAEIKMFGSYGLVELRPVLPSQLDDENEIGDSPIDEVQDNVASPSNDTDSEVIVERLWLHAKEMVKVSKAYFQDIDKLRRMKRGRRMPNKEKQGDDAVTPPTYPDSPRSPDCGGNVDHSESNGSQNKKDGDGIELPSRSTHVSGISSNPKKQPRIKIMGKRLVKKPYICKSPFVEGCAKQFNRIQHVHKVIADYALDEEADESEVLVSMHGYHITRNEMQSVKGKEWLNSVVIGMVCCVLNVDRGINRTSHYFDPCFAYALRELNKNGTPTKDEIVDRTKIYMEKKHVEIDLQQCDMLYIPVCDNHHWHLHVVNIGLLSSMSFGRRNNVPEDSRKLTYAIWRCLRAWGFKYASEFTKYDYAIVDVPKQKNGYDCGVFVIKYMEHWNGAVLTHSIDASQMQYHRLKIICTLIRNKDNREWLRIREACKVSLLCSSN